MSKPVLQALTLCKHKPYSEIKVKHQEGPYFCPADTYDTTCIHVYLISLSVGHCPSSFIQFGHSVQFVGLSSDDLTLSVCYVNGNQTAMMLYDVPTLASSVSPSFYHLI